MLNLIRVHELMLPNLALRAFGGPVLTRSERRMPLLLSVLPSVHFVSGTSFTLNPPLI